MKEYYKITGVARLYGLCTDTLRYYEEQGLLHPHRSEAGYRLYSIDDICNLNVIRALRELDMPVDVSKRQPGYSGTAPQWFRRWCAAISRNPISLATESWVPVSDGMPRMRNSPTPSARLTTEHPSRMRD